MNGYRTHVVWRFLGAVLVAVLLSDSISFAAERSSGTGQTGVPGRAIDGQTVNVVELARRQSGISSRGRENAGVLRRKPGSFRVRETNSAASATIGAGNTTTPLSAASEPLISAASVPPSPPLSASFVAALDNAVSFNPDTQGAVGPNHLMVTLGSEVRIQNRSGEVISSVSLDGFWGSLGSSNVFDPRVIYDQSNGRWITVAVSNPATSNSLVLVAVSQSNDPTGNWYRHGVRVDDIDGVYAASPNIGLSRDWITVQANMQDQTGLFYFSSDIFTFNKTNLYAGGSAAYRRFYHFPSGLPHGVIQEAATPVPMVSFDDSYPTNFLVANVGVIAGVGRLRIFSISGPIDDPFYDEYDQALYVGAGAAFGTPTWDSVSPGNDNFAPQAGTTNKIYIGDARIQNVVYRNGALWATHHVFLPANGPNRIAVQWWAFGPGGLVLQHGRMDDSSAGKMYAYPSIAVNRYEDVLIGYSRFAANQFPSANYAFHGYQDGPGRLQSDTVLKSGESKFTISDDGLVLWGDWSGTVVDPRNDTDMWTIQEYASSPVAAIERWGTWWGRVSPPTSMGVQITGSPDPLIAGSEVTYSIYVTNFTSHIATGVRITNTLPVGAVFVSASMTQGSCSQTNGVVVCTLGDVQGLVGTNVVVSGTIVARLNQAGTATNQVSVFGFSPDESSIDNSAVVTTSVATSADVALSLRATPNPVILSNNVTYSLTITNRGPSPAGSVFLTNTLPAEVSFVSASSSQGSCSHLAGKVTCNFGALAAGSGAAITIIARVAVSGSYTNVAVVTSTSLDPDLGNNFGSVVVNGNLLPTLQAISSRTINEDTVLGPIAFTVGDVETPLDSLVLTGLSSNPSVVPPGNIVFTGSGANRFITVTPAPNANGAATITRMLADSSGSIVSNSFVLTIIAINDPPTITDISSQVINEDTIVGPLALTIGDTETAAASLTLSGASSNPSLIPNANIQLSGSGANRTLRIIPTTNQSGSATITLTVSDGKVTANDTFVVTVNPVNDLPQISDIGNRTIGEDTSTSATSFTIGDVETPIVALVVTASSSNPTLVPTANIVMTGTTASRTVVVTPASNQFGVATIRISVTDTNNGTSSDSFVLTVSSVNDAPTLDVISPIVLSEDAGPQVVRLTGIGSGAANETTALTMTATSSNPGLIPSPGAISHSGSASTNSFIITPSANSNGNATITVVVNDGAGSNNVIVRSFGVTVTPVNDAPGIVGLVNRSINEDESTGAVPFIVSDVESTPGSLVALGDSSNTNLVPVSNIVFGGSGSNRTVQVTPARDQFGEVTITVRVRDVSATNSATFLLTVNPVNDAPTISSITNRIVNEDIATNISFTIGDKETVADVLTLSATSSNPSLVSAFSFAGTGSNRTINILPATNQSGSANITITVIDSEAGSNSATFAFSVLPVNDLPTLDAIPDMAVDEDSPVQVVVLTGISSGAANEIQPLAVTVVSSNAALFANVAASYGSGDTTGRLEFLPVRDANGAGTITVQVSDGISTNSRSFTVRLLPINDPPTISQLTNLEIDEDTTAIVPLFVSDLETSPGSLVVQVQSSNLELLDETGIAVEGTGTNRVLRLTPLADQSAASTVLTVTVVDGSNDVATTTFELGVRPVNDAPTISGLSRLTVQEDSVTNSVSFIVGDAESLPSSLLVSVSSANSTLFPGQNLVLGRADLGRTLSLTPSLNEFGTTTVSVVVREGADSGALAATNTFEVVVVPLNDPPTLNPIQSVVIPSGSPTQIINLSGIGMGAGNEGQTLTVSAISSDTGVVPNPLVSYASPSESGTLSFGPIAGAVGSILMTVSVTESGGILTGGSNQVVRSFAVTVTGPGPALTVEQLNGRAIISWSTNSPLNWQLESSTNVSVGASWVVSSTVPVVANGRFTVTNQINGVTRFYRLRNQ